MHKPYKRATIIDVAQSAGVSKSTVTRVLEGKSYVSESARARVLNAIKEMGYERNSLAASMRSGRSGLLAIVIPDISNPFWAEVTRGAQDRAISEGYSLLVFSSDWDTQKEAAHLQAIRQARVDGAIINPVADNFDAHFFSALPMVFIGSSAERFPQTSSVGSDIHQGIMLGLDTLQIKGHGLPAFILGPASRLARTRFLRVVEEYCQQHDIDPTQAIIEDGDYTVEGGQRAMKRLLTREKSTNAHLAVFAANDLMALGAMMASREAGLCCGKNVSVMGFDGIPAGAFSLPGLTTIQKPSRQIGRCAMESLVNEIAGRTECRHIHLPCELIDRGSVADLRTTDQ
jgi:LacI family transcriptional regulator